MTHTSKNVELLSSMDVALALELWRLRTLASHRKIATKDFAKELDCSVWLVKSVMNGSYIRAVSEATMWHWFERFDDAVTAITDRRGGVPHACCGMASYLEMIRDLLYTKGA